MLFKPFDFNPASVSVKTSSYSIPAGRFAYVVPHCRQSDFTIGGAIVNERKIYFTQAVSPGGSTTVTIPGTSLSGYFSIFFKDASATFDLTLRRGSNSNFDLTLGSTINEYIDSELLLNSGDQLIVPAWHPNNLGAYYVKGHFNSKDEPVGHWVPTGTSLNGDSYTVSEYIIPT